MNREGARLKDIQERPIPPENTKLRILMLHPFLTGVGISPFTGGKSLVAYQLTRELIEQGHTVAILPWKENLGQDCVFGIGECGRATVFATRPDSSALKWISKVVKHIRLFAKMGMRKAKENALVLMGIERAIGIFKPDLIHVQYTMSSFAGLYPALKNAPPAILTHYHGFGNDLESYSGIVFPSETQESEIIGKIPYQKGMTTVICLPVNPLYMRIRSQSRKERYYDEPFSFANNSANFFEELDDFVFHEAQSISFYKKRLC